MYEAPVQIVQTSQKILNDAIEDGIMTAVCQLGFHVDKEQLISALSQDKRRYENAYQKGWNDCQSIYEEKLEQMRQILDGGENGYSETRED